MEEINLPSTKPYLLRAIWEWCADNGFTPYISVVVDEFTHVPREFVRDGQIVLNIGSVAANKLQMGNDYIEFHGRFNGVARSLSVPIGRVIAIYGRENGIGMSFELEETVDGRTDKTAVGATALIDSSPENLPPDGGGKPHLRVVK
ncbi:MAG: hypothetical protein RIR18_1713 [Pseudomonadota bacterium]